MGLDLSGKLFTGVCKTTYMLESGQMLVNSGYCSTRHDRSAYKQAGGESV